jgi:hypothetical protein
MGQEIEKAKKAELKKAIASTEDLIKEAEGVIELWDRIAGDDESRQKVTGFAGGVVGATANTLLDAKDETDPNKKAQLLEIGTNSVMEMGRSMLSVLLAGNRRRLKKRGVPEKAKIVEEQELKTEE